MIVETIAQIDELIALTLKKVELFRELRHALDLANRAGVHPNEIARSGYDPAADPRWNRWPAHATAAMEPETNYVVLKDGRRIDLPPPEHWLRRNGPKPNITTPVNKG